MMVSGDIRTGGERERGRRVVRGVDGVRGVNGVKGEAGPFESHEYWIRVQEAAEILNVSTSNVFILAKQGRFTRVKGERPGAGRPNVLKRRYAYSWFLLDEILRCRDERDSKRRTISPAEWKRDLRHPIIRTDLTAPANDELIPVKEAARILNVHRTTVSHLVAEGKLFGWQKEPGKPGVRLWLSLNQVCRYAQNPERLRRRKAWEGKSPMNEGKWHEWEEMGIEEHPQRGPTRGTK